MEVMERQLSRERGISGYSAVRCVKNKELKCSVMQILDNKMKPFLRYIRDKVWVAGL